MNARIPRTLSNWLLAAASVIVALAAAEFLLRALVPPPKAYYVLSPDVDWALKPAPGALVGVHGPSHFRVNRFGVRGRPFGGDGAEYRILAIGGSTTRCVVLDDAEVWTHLLETQLGRTVDGSAAWVGNVGRDGATTPDHILHLKYLLPQYPRIDVVLVLVGVNDALSVLQYGWQYHPPDPLTTPAAERQQMPHAFAVIPGTLRDRAAFGRRGPAPWYKATALWQLGRMAKEVVESRQPFYLRDLGRQMEESRRERQTAAVWLDSLPPLAAPLREYRRNLNTMADLAAAAGARLVLVTQPSVWRERMSAAEDHLLSSGYVGMAWTSRRTYYTTGALARAMARYNETLLDVCRERRLDCVDAASRIPRDSTAMYDDVHFNEHGAELLAQVLAAHFRARAPFHRPS